MERSIITVNSNEGYDYMVDCLDSISNLANDPEVLEFAKECNSDKVKNQPILITFGMTAKTMQSLLKVHKDDIFRLVSGFFCRPVEETYKKSAYTVAKEFMQVITDPDIKELFDSAQSLKAKESSGSVQENTVERPFED